MYSEEIDKVLKQHGFNISNRVYEQICDGSTQITTVKFEPCSSTFTIWTNDNWNWTFKVYYES